MSRTRHLVLACALLPGALAAAAAQSQEIIHYWNVGNSDDARMYRRMAERFARETGIQVVVTPLGWGNFQQKYMTALAAHLPPDIGSTNFGGPFEYGSVGGLVDLAAEFPDDIEALKQEVFPGPWPPFEYEGKTFGIPHQITTLFLYYRSDIFARLQLSPPRTWQELDRAISVLNARNYQYGFFWTRGEAWATDLWTAPFGVRRYSPDGRTATWESQAFQHGITAALRLWTLYNMPQDKNTRPVALFALNDSSSGLAQPMFIDGAWRYMEIAQKAPELAGRWAIAPMPAAENGAQSLIGGGTALVIFRQSKHRQAAIRWARFIMSAEMQYEALLDHMRNRGDRADLYTSPNRRLYEQYAMPYDSVTAQTIRRALPAIALTPPVHGAVQADRQLESALEAARSAFDALLDRRARQHAMSTHDYKRALAARQFQGERARLLVQIDSLTAAMLTAAKPLADRALARARQDYEARYRPALETLAAGRHTWDVLDFAELAAVLLLAGLLGVVMLRPAQRRAWRSYLFIAPPLLSALIFMAIPMAVALYLSFTRYNPVLPLAASQWNGWQNYRELLLSPDLWLSLGRTLYFTAVVLPVQLIIGVLLAAGLNQALKPDRLWKFFYFSPLVTSVVAVALIWTTLFLGTRYGWINAALLKAGFIRDPVVFLRNPRTFLPCVMLMSIWHGLAFIILISLAGLQDIPRARYEAAAIDGATPWQRFLHVTLPGLRPQIIFLVIVGSIGALQVFEQIYLFGGGSQETGSKFGPADSGLTLVPLLFRTGFEDHHMGAASALAYLLFLALAGLSFLNLHWLREKPK